MTNAVAATSENRKDSIFYSLYRTLLLKLHLKLRNSVMGSTSNPNNLVMCQ